MPCCSWMVLLVLMMMMMMMTLLEMVVVWQTMYKSKALLPRLVRASIGKKKAKEIRASENSTKQQKLLDERTLARRVVMDDRDKVASGRNESMERIAAAAEAKNHVMQEQIIFNLFMEDWNSDETKVFLSLMRRKYTAQTMASITISYAGMQAVEGQQINPAEAFLIDMVTALRGPPILNVITLVNSIETRGTDENDMGSLVSGPPLSSTQRLLSALQESSAFCDVDMEGQVSDMSPALM